jgi:hypothetical protein
MTKPRELRPECDPRFALVEQVVIETVTGPSSRAEFRFGFRRWSATAAMWQTDADLTRHFGRDCRALWIDFADVSIARVFPIDARAADARKMRGHLFFSLDGRLCHLEVCRWPCIQRIRGRLGEIANATGGNLLGVRAKLFVFSAKASFVDPETKVLRPTRIPAVRIEADVGALAAARNQLTLYPARFGGEGNHHA